MLARPAALVTAVVLDKVALAPLAGAAKVTVTPGTGWLAASFTIATSGLVKAVPATVVCGLPELTAMDVAAAWAIARFSVLVPVKIGLLASVTVSTTAFEALTTVGVPEITPVEALMVKPAGNPVADQA
jgi:hypothetical protein